MLVAGSRNQSDGIIYAWPCGTGSLGAREIFASLDSINAIVADSMRIELLYLSGILNSGCYLSVPKPNDVEAMSTLAMEVTYWVEIPKLKRTAIPMPREAHIYQIVNGGSYRLLY
ncbi:uncharacterized protein MYCFIDRAFT_174533 [Pseudocercospora fijiensis CIRAD86]|uniref:Uncharacterized protein n=1 Tax=Pseudocercospora fijiensis (strain CIRAD86) TaxID=383855 RepID=M2YZJ4_PSEFD|nr:uncharacterized protein MYCFIDRAFT_174533 [Pseudocercospora fijiensis CIRAD86]EME83045.1 hypothetical protein MYCFIDRAFT_174533 [Pseudocercospora fijiensis CIRAD86]